MRYLLLVILAGLAACQSETTEPAAESAPADAMAEKAAMADAAGDGLVALLDAQPDDVKARYQYRNPQQTLEFFGIEPGMTVLEGLPGGGWYTKILMQHLGSDGTLLAANYNLDLYPLFSFMNEERLAEQAAWAENWSSTTADWGGDNGAGTAAFHFGSVPADFAGTADVVFFPRVLHNLARFQNSGDGDFLDEALTDVFTVLKPGGVFGVVQHRAPDDKSDEWADGSRGYLKEAFVIAVAEEAGFEYVGSSDVNLNPNDQPGEEDFVWRLPPSLVTSGENEELRAELIAIGESSRMTLKFVKPAE
ncbi:MAG: methyltransferase [Pseudomonadota bacterium]